MRGHEGFDIAIVGGGAAGCVVAARLASRGIRVGLIEAGPDLRVDPPHDLLDGWKMTGDFDWGYTAEPNEYGVVRNVRRVRLLGGTSNITRFALRGAPGDFDEWEALGNPGWGFADVLPYLTRLESDHDFGADPWHGAEGPIPVGRYLELEPSEVHLAARRALETAGFPRVADHNRPGAVGVGPMPMSSRSGVRTTTAGAYLPIGGSPASLTVWPDAQVDRVVLDGTRASGVRLIDGTVIAADLVVLCAGTYGSPPILMRSGIGPADHLRSVGVPVTLDLAGVGANLSDHPAIDLDLGFEGPSQATPLLHSVATFHSSVASPDGPPDLMFWLADPDTPDDPPQFTLDVLLLKPRSRGTVRLRSADPVEAPRIDLPNLRDPVDLDRLTEGHRLADEIARDPDLRRLCRGTLPTPMADPEARRQAVAREARSIPHVVGTCAMGPSPDDGAVVDVGGRVHGVDNLFVADASIMPTVPSGFTHLPTIMLAERLSESIGRN